jgi:LacI family transcriptional regulator
MASELSNRPHPRSDPSPVTINEVAAEAGVSTATVSRVLNGKGPVSAEASRRVLDATRALHYVPHGIARSLSTRRTNTVAVVLPDLYGEFFSEVIRGIDVAARRRGYHLLVSGSHSNLGEMKATLSAVRGRVDGVVVMSPDLDPSLAADFRTGVPMVLLNRVTDHGYAIAIDNYGGALAMARHLIGLGHRRIAFIKGPAKNADARERLRGYRQTMSEIEESTEGLEFPGDFTEDTGATAVERILALRSWPTAVFAANDAMAVGALTALREAGVRVPADIALAGFDDIRMSRYVTPTLTTVNVSIADLGRRALELLLEALERDGSEGRRETIPTRLVIRESCGALPQNKTRNRKRAEESIASLKGEVPP